MRAIICGLLLLSASWTGEAKSKHHRSQAHSGTVGKFDYYVFALSWSPEYCHSHQSAAQCTVAKPYSFIVHGLWPEYTSGSGPQNCKSAPGLKDPSKMLDIMPDAHLIDHEWTTHGTCSGLSAEDYFGAIRKAYNAVKIPANFQAPAQQFTVSPAQVSQQFSQANLKLPAEAVEVSCPGNYLSAVEICLDKSLNAMTCATPPPCNAKSIKVPPVK